MRLGRMGEEGAEDRTDGSVDSRCLGAFAVSWAQLYISGLWTRASSHCRVCLASLLSLPFFLLLILLLCSPKCTSQYQLPCLTSTAASAAPPATDSVPMQPQVQYPHQRPCLSFTAAFTTPE